jgi:cell division protein FtsA
LSKQLLAAGVDAGSAWTRCVISRVHRGEFRYLSHSIVPSSGWARGRITDQNAVSQSIEHAVRRAERLAQVSIDEITVGMGGSTIYGSNSRGVYEFGRPHEVEPADLSYAAELASKVRLEDDRLLLQVYPQDFTVDGRAGYRNPRGATCSRLEANVHVVTVSAHEHQCLVTAIHQAHLGVEDTVFEPMAASYGCLFREDRTRGVALIDIGAHSTDLIVFEGESVVLASSIPVCGDHFTGDVAQGLCVSYEDAQRLKEEYGCALLGLTSDNVLIEVPSAPGRAQREAPRRILNDFLEARAEELFLYVRGEMQRAGMEQALMEGVILTGGGAMLNGMCDMAERVLNFQARNGLPVGIGDWPDELNNPAWAVAAGLAMYSARLKMRHDRRRKAPNILGIASR